VLASCREGDAVKLDANAGRLKAKVWDGGFARRKRDWKPRDPEFTSGYLWKYAQQVGPARNGAVTHPGGAAETTCYADY